MKSQEDAASSWCNIFELDYFQKTFKFLCYVFDFFRHTENILIFYSKFDYIADSTVLALAHCEC